MDEFAKKKYKKEILHLTHSREASRGRIYTKFGIAVRVAAVISSNIFGDRSRGVDFMADQKLPSPIHKASRR